MMSVRLQPTAPLSRVKHSTTEPRDEISQPFSIRKICRLTPKWRKAISKSPFKGLNHKISIETSQFMLNLYLKLSSTSFKNKFQQKQLAFYKSYASAQSGNPDQS